ncbi:hypothetical protein PkoCFBP13504_05795 [Pseudomonas koreensis]|nr:hypothetical protein PkoCFBP13504_05795 [Pseudomonas koreensis]
MVVVTAVAMAAVRAAVIAAQITEVPIATAVAMGSVVIMRARPLATMAKAVTTTAVIAMGTAVTAQRLQASPIPKIRAA